MHAGRTSHSFRRRLRGLQQRKNNNQPYDQGLLKLRRDMDRSSLSALLSDKRALPTPEFPARSCRSPRVSMISAS